MQSLTTETHGVELDLGVSAAVEHPDPPFPSRAPADLPLADGGAAIDQREALPAYGPRPEGEPEPEREPEPLARRASRRSPALSG